MNTVLLIGSFELMPNGLIWVFHKSRRIKLDSPLAS